MINNTYMNGQISRQKNPPLKIISILIVASAIAGSLFWLFDVKPALAGSAILSWMANSESDIAGYKIYYGLSPRTGSCPPGGYPNKIDAGKTNTPDKPSYIIGNLEDGKTYYFSLTGYDVSDNESCFSAEINKTIPQKELSWYESISRFFQSVFSPLNVLFPKIF